MASSDELTSFIASSFRSVWALELLLLLKREGRACSTDELVTLMRASPSVVEKALESLIAAGLAGTDGDIASYMPISVDVGSLVEQTEHLYRSRPDRVRRLIIASSSKGLAAFSDAFRLKD
jgi:DNA-binding IclR family transcriptional regulator